MPSTPPASAPALSTAPSAPAVDAASRAPTAKPAGNLTPWLVAVLLALYACMAGTAAWQKGVSFDEAQQLAVGYNLWLNADYRMEGGNGDFVKRWATLPYLISRPKFVPRSDSNWQQAYPYELAYGFFFEMGNSPEGLLRQGRLMMILLGAATGLLVFSCTRELFGRAAALLSLSVFIFSPNILAFSALVSTDITITFALLGSTCCVWRLLHRVTLGRIVVSLLFSAALILAKPSALVILPIAAVLVAVKLRFGTELVLTWGRREKLIASRTHQFGVFTALFALHAAFGWGAIWAHYGFRYAASPEPNNPALALRPIVRPPTAENAPASQRFLDWTRDTRFFPEGFRRGIRSLVNTTDGLRSFMAGTLRNGGHPAFFPYALWVKTPPAVLILLALAISMILLHARPSAPPAALPPSSPGSYPSHWYELTPHLTLIVVYLAVAMAEDINLGYRHILPIVPPLYVLLGAAALAWRRWGRAGKLSLLALPAWLAADSLAVQPHYLAYFGAQVGGPAKGYTRLLDSSLDWGMNLPDLKRWLDRHNPDNKELVFLAYFGTDKPAHYGIQARRLPGFFDWRPPEGYPLGPGIYALSASLYQGLHSAAFGPWNKDFERLYHATLANVREFELANENPEKKAQLLQRAPAAFWQSEFELFDQLRFARLCAWLRHNRSPEDQVAYGILIWRLTFTDLEAALFGPPAELAETSLEPLEPALRRRK